MASPFIPSMQEHLRARFYSKRIAETYIYWILGFIRFYNRRHPREQEESDIVAFLEHLAVKRHVTLSTQKTALNALMYLYKQVLGRESLILPDYRNFVSRH